MQNANEKIGHLVAQIRQERGLTQAEFAKLLHTSQSAVNRIEHGKQNVSIETLGRISDVLNKQLISLSGRGINLRIEGGHELSGEITLKNSKNAAVGLLCASLLNYGVTKFVNFPKIEEVFRIIEVLVSIGVQIRWLNGTDLEIRRPQRLKLENIDADAARKTRSVLMLMGPLLHDHKEFKIPYAGGCKLGERTVEPHLFALEAFGLHVKTPRGHYEVHVNKKPAGRIVLYETGDTVTENAITAAARTTEETIIQYASANYAVQDVCLFLKKLGVKIDGIGSTVLKIQGVSSIKKNVTFALAEDPIEAMLFISAAVVTNSSITIRRVPIDFLSLEVFKLQKMGLRIDQSERYKALNGYTDLVDLTIHKHNGTLRALADKIHPNVYPAGINADNLPYFVPIAGVITGRTLIHDWMYENRAIHCTEMTKVGMNIELADPHRLYIVGPTKFSANDVVCPPALRPASLLLIGMLAADGVSTLRNIYTINRGYEDIAERLNSLGARIQIFHEM
ncbi:MAG TPA: UDP-N-acetylglucosamine 1-carboxyvinyltransferase [Candidatus Saccharimonadales bacterium]|nr:UDP-N-acetylglucosamine 1-carboxyvinyltransferase [Candidatus Saccharimonadales bacterium]